MDILPFFQMFYGFMAGIYLKVFGISFNVGDVRVSLHQILIAAGITIMAISMFWRGAKR